MVYAFACGRAHFLLAASGAAQQCTKGSRALEITLNGRREALAAPQSVATLAEARGYRKDRIAVELNGAVLARARWESTVLQSGDRMEIVTFVGGG